ncbi:uncharacterized protein LOC143539227 [Bidens hawaiensis]|uniref:uncharacterized protein LOC143539227 n=1 Tax=Bidens hawaiensis TaxID=980011 RepID=UPI00404AEE40
MQPTSRAEADRLLGIAATLLEQKDLSVARDFALLAQETDPLLDASDQIMAITDVLIAADKQINNLNHHHLYAVLNIDIHRTNDPESIKQQYRRLAILLHPDKNKFAFSRDAFKLVGDTWAVLSNPGMKMAFDKELLEFFNKNQREKMPVRRNAGNNKGLLENMNIWTLCPYCYYLYEYPKVLEGYCLRCQHCDRAFQVVVIPAEALPPMVPGQDAYCCSWLYYPIASVSDRIPKETSSEKTAPVSRKRDRPVKNPIS